MALETQRQSSLPWLLIGSVAIGILGDYLFYGKAFGISYPLFVIGLYALFFWQAKQRIHLTFSRDQFYAWSLTLPIFLLALTFFLYDNAFFHLLNFVIVPFLLVAQTMLLTKRHQQSWFSLGFLGEMIETVLLYTIKYTSIPFLLLREWIKNRVDRTKYGVAMKVLTGIGISLPILLVVLSLLSQADGVFGHFLAEIPRMLFDWNSAEALFRLFLIGLVALVTFGYMYSILGPRQQGVAVLVPAQSEENKIAWDGIILVTILTIINVVYIVFTVIQISYLFGGAQAILPEDMTYAEYAKKGFNELVTVTIINFILLVSFMYLASRAQKLIYRIVQVMLSLLTVCTSCMLISAYFRLSLYEEAYGYTHTRFLAHAFMIFLLVLFVIAFLKIWRNGFSLMKYYGVAGIVAYVVLNYINVDVLIAKNNIQRYHDTGRIDMEYLAELSYDAIPVIMTLKNDKAVASTLQYNLQEKAEDLQEERSWQSFNVARYVAKSYLE
ncbi:hypothetical protein AN963_13945 [Brevibacillus choshinensis]|uniref:DUF4173 domain-containing protein n=1 Tax=Brevibacillus choshinensis TaxID=54911 RepID=A0ABR5N6T0_BRECH|nr:DUF4173 domain-containing protein [Brevibacillus choshinensis]KQL46094.1 hypothetical protein AN963_13945 [Brevibacillus choshinensis]